MLIFITHCKNKKIIDNLILYDDKIELYFNNPTSKSPDESRGFLFCSYSTKIVQEKENKKPSITDILIEMYLG